MGHSDLGGPSPAQSVVREVWPSWAVQFGFERLFRFRKEILGRSDIPSSIIGPTGGSHIGLSWPQAVGSR